MVSGVRLLCGWEAVWGEDLREGMFGGGSQVGGHLLCTGHGNICPSEGVYPQATVWFTGHSLGGALAAVMAAAIPRTNAITFEAPGERLFVERLGLDPTNESGIMD